MNIILFLGIVISFGLGFFFLWKNKAKYSWVFLIIGVLLMAILVGPSSEGKPAIANAQEMYIDYHGDISVDILNDISLDLTEIPELDPQDHEATFFRLKIIDVLGNEKFYTLYHLKGTQVFIQEGNQYFALDASVSDKIIDLYGPQNRLDYEGQVPNLVRSDIIDGVIPFLVSEIDQTMDYYHPKVEAKQIYVYYTDGDEYQYDNIVIEEYSNFNISVPEWAKDVYISFPGFSTVRATTMIEGFPTKRYNIPNRFSMVPLAGSGEERHVIHLGRDALKETLVAKVLAVFADEPVIEDTESYGEYVISIIFE